MRKTLSFLLAILAAGVFISGCKEKPVTIPEDVAAPKIIMSSPAVLPVGQWTTVNNQDSFAVDIRFEDDIELASYRIEIRRREDLYFLKTNTDAWNKEYFGTLEGTVDAINFFVYLPFDPAAGPYEFDVFCTDAAGKVTELETYLFVKNDRDLVPPIVRYVTPDTNLVDTFLIGSNIPLKVNISDPGLVVNIFSRVRDAFTNEVMDGSTINVDTLFVPAYQLDTFVTIPAGTVPGKYKVETYANDQTGNYRYNLDTIYVKPN